MEREIKKVGDKFEVKEIGTAVLDVKGLEDFRARLLGQKKNLKDRLVELDKEIADVNVALGKAPEDQK